MAGIPIKPILTFFLFVLLSAGAATGIAIAVVEWRGDTVDLEPIDERLTTLETRYDQLGEDLDGLRSDVGALVLQPTPTPTRAPKATPASTPPSPEAGSSRDNPVQRGEALLVAQGWEITVADFVTGVDYPPNYLYVTEEKLTMVRVHSINVSAGDPADLRALGFALVGSTGTVYGMLEPVTSILHDLFTRGLVVQGGTVEGNIAFIIPENETPLLLMTGEGGTKRFFAVE